MISETTSECIRQWHDAALKAQGEGDGSSQTFQYLGRTLVVPSDVHSIVGLSHVLGEAVLAEVSPGERVLDLGTASGVNAILAASRGAHVVAVDVNSCAVQAARRNVDGSGFAERIEVCLGNLFGGLEGAFDVVIYEPTFRWHSPRNLVRAALCDENYRAMLVFVRGVRRYLSPSGRALIFVDASGDVDYLARLAHDAGLTTLRIAKEGVLENGARIDHFVCRLCPETHATPSSVGSLS